jgi:hypothetical protein
MTFGDAHARWGRVVLVVAVLLAGCGDRPVGRADAGPDGGGSGCGPYPGGECPGTQVCNVSGCAAGAGGSCGDRPTTCNDLYAPVCGCDDVTYENDCQRLAAGAALGYQGVCFGGCLDSDLEPNNTKETATSLDGALAGHPQGVSLYGVEICTPTDLDYYSFTVSAPKNATILVQYTRAEGELSASLLDASLAVVTGGAPVGGGLQLTATLGPQSGYYYLLVQAGPGGTLNKYDFSLTFQ